MKTLTVNQSKVKMWRRCQKQFAFRFDYAPKGKELVPKRPGLPLTKGSWLHALLEEHHKEWAGVPTDGWEAKQDELASAFEAQFEEEREELGDLPGECARLFKGYLRVWRSDVDSYRVASLHGGDPGIEFVVSLGLPGFGDNCTFKGRLDLLVEDLEYGGLWLWDHKWVKTVPSADERMMSPQAALYVWALRKLKYDVRGFLFNYGRTKAPVIPHVLKRPPGVLSQRKNMDTDYHTYLSEIKQVHGDRWKVYAKNVYRDTLLRLKGREQLWFRRERIPIGGEQIEQAMKEFSVSVRGIMGRANKNIAPRSYFYSCNRTCAYHDLCVAEFMGMDIEPLISRNFTYEKERYAEEDLLRE